MGLTRKVCRGVPYYNVHVMYKVPSYMWARDVVQFSISTAPDESECIRSLLGGSGRYSLLASRRCRFEITILLKTRHTPYSFQ